MKLTRPTDLKKPTPTQVRKRAEELLAEDERRERERKLAQKEGQAIDQLTDELNDGWFNTAAADQAAAAGMTFVRDVWPDHPAAGHLVAEAGAGRSGLRPCGVRRPFRLADDGVWFLDHWLCSPMFPAGRLPEGPIVVAFRVDDGSWRLGVPTAPGANLGGYAEGGFDTLRSFGLRINPEVLRGRPEFEPEPVKAGVFADGALINAGGQAVADGTVRSSVDLLWRFINATQSESPWEAPAA